MSPTLLKAAGLSISIKDLPIVQEVTFEASPGTFIGIIGPNGSGKTTLLKALTGIQSFKGEVRFKNVSIGQWNRKKLASYLAVVNQNATIHFDFTVLDFVLLGRMPHHKWLANVSKFDYALVDNVLASLQLEHLKHRIVTTLSGGERQRVLLAQALTQQPELLILDEPTANLDIYFQLDLLNKLRDLVHKGLTVISVFHDIELAAQYADFILVLHQGRQVTFGPSPNVITAQLLEQVFSVKSNITRDANNQVHIQYLNTSS